VLFGPFSRPVKRRWKRIGSWRASRIRKRKGAVGAELDRLRGRGPGGIGDHRGRFRPPHVDDDKRLVEDARHRESLGGRHPGEVGRAGVGEIGEPDPFELAHRSEAVVEAEARQPEIDVDLPESSANREPGQSIDHIGRGRRSVASVLGR
jgi:hypothetical protein